MREPYLLVALTLSCAALAPSQSSIFTVGRTFAVGAGSGTVGALTASIQMVVADFNGDGKADIATVDSAATTVTVLLGDGTGGFTEAPGSPVALPVYGAAIATGDFNGDGNPDLVISSVRGTTVRAGLQRVEELYLPIWS